MHTTRQHAENYLALGWSVFPCKVATKRPAVRSWKPYQSTRTNRDKLARWFDGADRNIAIVCGDVSDDLVVRDFDSKGQYEQWSANHRDLAKSLPTARTANGYHCYARMSPCPRVRVNGVGDGELRGNGAYVIAPPSVHPSGAVYEWIVQPFAKLQLVELSDLDLVHLEGKLSYGEVLQSQQSQRSQQSKLSQQKPTDVVSVVSNFSSQVSDAIAASVPKTSGQRNRCLFDLARRIKGISSEPMLMDELIDVFDHWYELSESRLGTKDYATSLDDFLRAIENAQTPYGATMAEHLNQAIRDGCPPWIASSKFDPKCKVLASLCRTLQRANGDDPFYLSAHVAGELVGVKPMQCWRWLDLFVRLERILKVETGNFTQRKATRFRYVADDL